MQLGDLWAGLLGAVVGAIVGGAVTLLASVIVERQRSRAKRAFEYTTRSFRLWSMASCCTQAAGFGRRQPLRLKNTNGVSKS
jgi:hypothetical protein